MSRSNPLTPSFNAGEATPRLAARTDFNKYRALCATCLNLIPLPEGGLLRRPGSRFVKEVKSSAVKSRLRRFEFSTEQAYMIEMAEQAFRFYRFQAQIAVADTDAAITNGTFPAGITSWDNRSTGTGSIAHDATNFRLSLVPGGTAADAVGWAEQAVTVGASFQAVSHVVQFQVIGAPSDRVELRIGTSSTGSQLIADKLYEVGYHTVAFTPGAATVYIQFRNRGNFRNKTVQIDNVALIDTAAVELQTPYTEAQLYAITGMQSADVLYLFHAAQPVYKLQRYGHTSWSLVQVAWQDGPWMEENATTTTLIAGAATGLGVSLTASAITGINDDTGFQTTDVGRLVRFTDEATVNWGWGIIVGRTSTTVVTVDIRRTFVSIAAETKWRLGGWSATTGYPTCGTFYEQRLFAANTTEQPQTFWAAQTADFENMAPDSPNAAGTTWAGTVEDDDALDYTISADQVNAIRWMTAGDDVLAIGTAGGEWIPSSAGAVLTPADIVVRRQTNHGSAAVEPLRIDNVVLFVHRAARKVLEFAFNFESDGYRAFDMTRLAQHVTVGGVVEMAFAPEPNDLVYVVRSDGILATMTYRREEDVVGWARHIFGGVFGSGNAVVESVAVIPGDDGTGSGQVQDSTHRDEVWVIVKRTINGATKRYIEVLEEDFEGPNDSEYETEDAWTAAVLAAQADAYYADSLITYDGVATTSIAGLDHLEGQTVKVWADGAIHPDATVTSGAITLEAEASVVQVGLGYTHRFKSLKIEGGTAVGTALGKPKRITGITFILLNSHTLSFGPDLETLDEIDFREVEDAMDSGVPLFTGEVFREFDGNWETDSRIVIESDDPCPFGLLALAPEVTVNELR